MKEIFVPYEVRLKLDEIGFDTPCIAYYGAEINTTYPFNFQYKPVLISAITPSESAIPAPTWEQVFKWFREKGIICSINPRLYANLFFYEIFVKENGEAKRTYIGNENMSYEECREKLILKMIKIYGNK